MRAGGAMLAVDGVEPAATAVHHLLDDGSFAITVPVNGLVAGMVVAAGTAGVQAVLEMTDYAPLPLREPVRSLVWIRGRVQAVPRRDVPDLLDLIAAEESESRTAASEHGRSAGLPRRHPVGADAARDRIRRRRRLDRRRGRRRQHAARARPDPFCAMESCWLQHLESAHREVVDRLANRLPTPLRRGRVRPLGLDRYGVQLRVENDDGDHDVRLPFANARRRRDRAQPGDSVLMGCPFLNGLRRAARRLTEASGLSPRRYRSFGDRGPTS